MKVEEILTFRHKLLPTPKYSLNISLENIEGEIWKDIPDYIGLYQASNLGRIKSLSRSIQWKGYIRCKITKELIMKQCDDKDGYKLLTLNDINKNRKQFRVHRIVLLAFLGTPPKGKEIGLHLDDNPSNNCLANLKWGDSFENMSQCSKNGRMIGFKGKEGKKGSSHVKARKVIQLDLYGNEIALHGSLTEAATLFNMHPCNISDVLSGKQKNICWV